MKESSLFINVDYTNLDAKDLNMYYCGHRTNIPGHSYGPAMRDHYLLVYIVDGCGIYQINNITYPVKAGQMFVVFPHCKVFYQADSQTPWETIWIGLYGSILEQHMQYLGLSSENPIYTLTETLKLEPLLLELVDCAQNQRMYSQIRCISHLYQIFSLLLQDCQENRNAGKATVKERYMDRALNYIKYNYNRDITCSDVAAHVNLDRSYFSKLFKEKTELSPTEYLIRCRMEKASSLLRETDLDIESISYSVGISDPFYFSRQFKKYYGTSPQGYRKNMSSSFFNT